MCILNKRTCVAVEIDGFFRVEGHAFLWVHFQYKVFQCAKSHHAGNINSFLFGNAVQFTEFLRGFAGSADHFFYQVVGIHHRSFAAFHFSFGKFHHAVGEMHQIFSPGKTEFVEQYGEYLKMVILLITNYIYHFLNRIFFVADFSCADVLRHVNRCAVRTQQQLFVQSVGGEVCPHGIVLPLVKHSFCHPFFHFFFALGVSFGFVVYFIKIDSEFTVCFVKTGVHPSVHSVPQRAHLFIALFPFQQHFLCLADERRFFFGFLFAQAFFHQFPDFGFVRLIELHVVFSHQVVAFHAGAFRCFAVAEEFPGKHGFADVNAAIVYYVSFHHLPAVGFLNFGDAETEQVVADMTQVKGFVRIR